MRTYDRFAGTCAILVGVGGLVYGILFGAIVLGATRPVAIVWLSLGVLGALLATPVSVALYYRLRDTDRGFALLALLLGLAAALGQLENSALGLGGALSPEVAGPGAPADPFGVFRFGLAGVALFVVGWLVVRGGALPGGWDTGPGRRDPPRPGVPGAAHRRDRPGHPDQRASPRPVRRGRAPHPLRVARGRPPPAGDDRPGLTSRAGIIRGARGKVCTLWRWRGDELG